MQPRNEAKRPKIFVVGLGPGGRDEITPLALAALERCDVIVGYSVYIDLVNEILPGRDARPFPMKHEVERCRSTLALAQSGQVVGIVSSGDPGVYGMAGVMLEVVRESGFDVDVEIVAGITACCSAAARIGAPLTHDFAVISLSDLLTPWTVIERRLRLAAEADFVICIYNPSSRKRRDHLVRACHTILTHRSFDTPAAWVRLAGRAGESFRVMTLAELADCSEEVDMFCTVFVGNSATHAWDNRLVTPRGYDFSGVSGG